ADKQYPANLARLDQPATFTSSVTVDTLRVRGPLRIGSETGTSETPNPAGLVIRRINSTDRHTNQVVARTDRLTLERDGTSGGFLIRYPATPGFITIACLGINSTGGPENCYTTLDHPGTGVISHVHDNRPAVRHLR